MATHMYSGEPPRCYRADCTELAMYLVAHMTTGERRYVCTKHQPRPQWAFYDIEYEAEPQPFTVVEGG